MVPYANKTLNFCEYNTNAFIAQSLNFYFKHEIQLTKALADHYREVLGNL